MAPLEPPDVHRLRAALGWVELGLPAEASAELAELTPENRDHPDVLELRWEICATRKQWLMALELADQLVRRTPERASGWIHRAYTLRRSPGGGLQAAWNALRPAYDRFPKEPIISYNLACYAAQAGRVSEAMEWLTKAKAVASSSAKIKEMALADTDLESLWEQIQGW